MELKLNAILKEEAKKSIIEKTRHCYYGGKPTGTETDLYIGQTRVTIRQGVVQSEIPAEGPISKEIEDFVVGVRAEFMMYEDFLGITRDRGKYALPDDTETTGTVELYSKGSVQVICYGPTREKTLALFELIRGGKIRPHDEFDGPQSGKSRAQLEAELTSTQQQLGEALVEVDRMTNQANDAFDLRQDLNKLTTKHVALRQAIGGFANELITTTEKQFGLRWRPLCIRANVVRQINAILYGK